MQIVRKTEKLKSREPLILLGLRRVIQVLLPLGSGGTPVQVQVLSPAPIMKESLVWLFYYFMRKFIGLEPALGEAEHNREFARHLRMMGRAHQVLSPAPKNRNPICSGFCFLYIAKQFPKKILSLDSCIAKGEYLFE